MWPQFRGGNRGESPHPFFRSFNPPLLPPCFTSLHYSLPPLCIPLLYLPVLELQVQETEFKPPPPLFHNLRSAFSFNDFRNFFLLLPSNDMLMDYYMSSRDSSPCDIGGRVVLRKKSAGEE